MSRPQRQRLPARPFLPGAAALLIALLPGPHAAAQEILPFSEIRPGMKGIGRTVFSGTRVEEFQVEVIGTLQNVAPRRNLILVKLSGGPLASTGVLDGMSGSPVYFGDRLAGAVAYAWGFAREPVAGVTPIQEMLSIEDKETPALSPRARSGIPSEAGPGGLHWLRDPAAIATHFASYFDRAAGAAALSQVAPLRTPLLIGGLPSPVVEALRPGLERAGFMPIQGGGSGRAGTEGETRLVPGAGVGIKLARGDVEIAAVCTVTTVERDRVLACGHPLLNLGPTDLPMTTAVVHGLFPSLQESFKFASAGDEIGAFRQDRATGVFGYLGKKPRLFPVRLEIQPQKGPPRRYAFDVAEDPFLAPYILYAALNGILSNEQKDFGAVAIEYREGTSLRVSGEEPITLHNIFSGDLAPLYASGTIAFLTQVLLNNEYRPVHVEGINLIFGYADEERTARLERAWVSRDRARPGETVQVSIVLKPFRGPAVTRQVDLKIPEEARPGRLLLQVGDGISMARADPDGDDEFAPRDLKQLIWLINHLRSNSTIYAVLARADNGIVYQGERLPNLPPSVAQVMVRPQSRGNYLRLYLRGLGEEAIETDFMLTGYKLLSIDVEE